MSNTKLVRIKPSNKRESHAAFGVTIRKSDGWCEVPAHVADQLAKERMNDLHPEASERVFDVMDKSEASEVSEAEQAKEEPAGTVEKPRVLTPASGEPKPAEPKRKGSGG